MKKLITVTIAAIFITMAVSAQKLNTKYVNGFPSTGYSCSVGSDVSYFSFYGTKSFSAPYVITTSGTPVAGSTLIIHYDGSSVTAGSYYVSVIGVTLTSAQSMQKYLFLCVYRPGTSTWEVSYRPDGSSTGWVTKGNLGVITDDSTLYNTPSRGIYVKPLGLTNTHISGSAAIAYSKLALTGAILNTDVNTSAGIAWSKLAAGTASRALVSDGSGYPTTSSVTSTELGYVSGVTSAIQTQINAKTTSGAIVNADVNASAAIAYSKLALTGSIVNADIASGAAIAASKLSLGCTPTELTYLSGATSNLQTQINALNGGRLTYGSVSTTTTLTSSTIKESITVNSSGGGFNVTLPLASTCSAGTFVEFYLQGPNTAKILSQGSDKIFNAYAASVTSDTITATHRGVMMYSDGSANWTVARKY